MEAQKLILKPKMLKILKDQKINDFEKGPIRRSLFSNGAMSIVHNAKGFSGAKVQLHFIAGSMFEGEKEEGLSHLIEHLIFKENTTDYIKQLELSGATVNAYTYKENVCFEMSCLTKNLETLLPTFLKKFFTLEFSDENLRKEKIVIAKELLEDMDDHETQAIEHLFKKNFSRDLGHPVGGTVASVKKFTRPQVDKFYKKYYKPSRIILSIAAGDDCTFVEDIFKDAMVERYGNGEGKPFRLKSTDKISKLKHIKTTQRKKLENTLLLLSFNGPSITSKKFYDYAVLDELLFQGLNSVFFKKLRNDKPLVYGYGSSLNCFRSCGNYLMIFTTQKEDLASVKKEVKEVLEGKKREFLNEEEIESVKQRILDHWELSFDDLEERVEFLAGTEIYQLKEYRISDVAQRIKSVSTTSLKKLINQMVSTDYSMLSIVPS